MLECSIFKKPVFYHGSHFAHRKYLCPTYVFVPYMFVIRRNLYMTEHSIPFHLSVALSSDAIYFMQIVHIVLHHLRDDR